MGVGPDDLAAVPTDDGGQVWTFADPTVRLLVLCSPYSDDIPSISSVTLRGVDSEEAFESNAVRRVQRTDGSNAVVLGFPAVAEAVEVLSGGTVVATLPATTLEEDENCWIVEPSTESICGRWVRAIIEMPIPGSSGVAIRMVEPERSVGPDAAGFWVTNSAELRENVLTVDVSLSPPSESGEVVKFVRYLEGDSFIEIVPPFSVTILSSAANSDS